MTILATPTGQDLAALGQARAQAHGALDAIHNAKAAARHQLDAADAARAALQEQHAQRALDAALGREGAQAQLEAVERRAEDLQRETSRAQRVIVGADAQMPGAKAALRSAAVAEAHAKLAQLEAVERAGIEERRRSADSQDAAPEPIGSVVSAKYQEVYRAAQLPVRASLLRAHERSDLLPPVGAAARPRRSRPAHLAAPAQRPARAGAAGRGHSRNSGRAPRVGGWGMTTWNRNRTPYQG